MGRKVILTVAPTGGVATKSDHPKLPTQPLEIAETVARCAALGASVVALHARRPDDSPTASPEVYGEINRLVRERCDIIINNSTGGGPWGEMVRPMAGGLYEHDFDKRMEGLESDPEMATFDGQTGVSLFGDKEIIAHTTPSESRRQAARMKELGIKPEWEVFSLEHILQDLIWLIEAGYDKPPYYVNIVLGANRGFQGSLPYTPKILQMMVDALPEGSTFCVSGVGPAQLPATTQGLVLGGHMRVGLEDNFYLTKGVLATNEELVERAVALIHDLGLEVATPTEAREILGLKPRPAVAS